MYSTSRKMDWPIYLPLRATWKLSKKKTKTQACPQSRPEWAFIATGTRSYFCIIFSPPLNFQPQEKKEVVFFFPRPISKALTCSSKHWFCQLHKLLGKLLKRQITASQASAPEILTWGVWGRYPRIYIYCRSAVWVERKWGTGLLAEGLTENSDPALRFCLCHV